MFPNRVSSGRERQTEKKRSEYPETLHWIDPGFEGVCADVTRKSGDYTEERAPHADKMIARSNFQRNAANVCRVFVVRSSCAPVSSGAVGQCARDPPSTGDDDASVQHRILEHQGRRMRCRIGIQAELLTQPDSRCRLPFAVSQAGDQPFHVRRLGELLGL